MTQPRRIDAQPAFVLHAYPFKETSLVVEVFSRDYGRVPLVARGARRARSALRGVLQAFQPLELSWFGHGEVRTLAKAEWLGGQPLLGGQALLCAYYLNELLMRLLARDDAHQALFEHYAAALRELASSAAQPPLLRRFEKNLLRELGYGLQLATAADTGAPILAAGRYAYIIERGPVSVEAASAGAHPMVSGRTLLAMASDDFSGAQTLAETRQLMRHLIDYYLGAQPLQSRRVFKELQEL